MEQLTVPYDENLTVSPVGEIRHFLWEDNGYRPKTHIFLAYNRDALRVRLQAAETALRAVAGADDGPVWEDNCLEFFFQPLPEDPVYLNFECNVLGQMIVQKGTYRDERVFLTEQVKPRLEPVITIRPGKDWAVEYTLPFGVIAEIYGRPYTPKKGDTFRCNFYCCGDSTAFPHYGAWSDIPSEVMDFHQSRFFGEGVWG